MTKEGPRLFPLARSVLRNAAELQHAARQIGRLSNNGLVLGANQQTLYMPERNMIVREFIRSFPDVSLRIVSGQSATLYALLRSGEIDMALASEPTPDGFDIPPLCTYRSALLIPTESPLAAGEYIELDRLSGHHVLTLYNDYNTKMKELQTMRSAAGVILHDFPRS